MSSLQVSSVKSAFAGLQCRQVRQFLLFCLPALIVGILLRVMMLQSIPWGYYQPDSPDVLETASHFVKDGKLTIHPKKVFLVPYLYTAAVLIPKVPAMKTIPVLQHLLGVVLILGVGVLVRLWFKHWKWFIIPVTLLVAIHPSLLWFEHTLMTESIYLFTVVLLAVVGTLFGLAMVARPEPDLADAEKTRQRSLWILFAALCVSMVLVAGGRPEGKLFFGFGVLVLLLHWQFWNRSLLAFGLVLVLGIVTHFCTRTSQAGLLLYTSVAHMTPDDLKCAPGLGSYLAPIRDDLLKKDVGTVNFPRVQDRRKIASAMDHYLKANHYTGSSRKQAVEELCGKAAKEVIVRNWYRLPWHFYVKFRYTAVLMTNNSFQRSQLVKKQLEAYGKEGPANYLSVQMFGKPLNSRQDILAFLQENFKADRVKWFNHLHEKWEHAWKKGMLFRYSRGDETRGIPIYFFLALAGVVVAMIQPGPLRRFHVAWGLMLLGLLWVVILTANVKPRFRFVFEPFIIIYAFFLLDALVTAVARLFRPTQKSS